MSDIDEIIQELERKAVKKPKNDAYMAVIFADLVFALLDAISGLGVAYITKVWYYGVVVFFAGIIPLILWQKFYVNPFASDTQKTAAMWGGGLAVLSVVVVAGAVATLRLMEADNLSIEVGMLVLLVLIASAHGVIAAFYYYSDEEISENQKAARMVGRAARKIMEYKTAEKVLLATEKSVSEKKRVSNKFSAEAVKAVLDDERPN